MAVATRTGTTVASTASVFCLVCAGDDGVPRVILTPVVGGCTSYGGVAASGTTPSQGGTLVPVVARVDTARVRKQVLATRVDEEGVVVQWPSGEAQHGARALV